MTDNPTPPQGVPSDEELFQYYKLLCAHGLVNALNYLKEVRDRTEAAIEARGYVNDLVTVAKEQIHELEAELGLSNTAMQEARDQLIKEKLYTQHLEGELKSAQAQERMKTLMEWYQKMYFSEDVPSRWLMELRHAAEEAEKEARK